MIEREVKLSAWPGFRLPDLDGVAEGARTRRRETIDLDATYYDTPDLRLGRRGITLRHRRRGARETWTLKLPADGGDEDLLARAEIEVSGPPGDVPPEIDLLVAAHVRTASLTRIAHLLTVRRRTVVEGPGGTPLAEIDDDEVSVMDGGRVAARFRELEVEVAADVDDEVARRVVDRLGAAGAEPGGLVPKVARAVGPRFLDLPEAAEHVLAADPTAGEVVEAALRASTARLLDNHALAVQGDDPEGVHQMRVAARRLRSDLRTFRPLLDRDVTDPLRGELRWLGEVLGAVRDPDVLAEQLRDIAGTVLEPDDDAALDAVLARLDAERDGAVAALHEALGSDRFRQLVDRVVGVAEAPPRRAKADRPAADVLPGLVAGPWTTLRDQVAALGDDPEDAALHEVRKRAKQVRYAAEAVAPAIGKPARRAGKGIKKVQDVLGDHQDTVVAEEWLRGALAGSELSTEGAFVVGALVSGERQRRHELREAWPGRWERASDPDRWEWVG